MTWKTKLVMAEDVIIHAHNYGVNRTPIFLESSHYEYFLAEMAAQLSPVTGASPLFYILMRDHYHIVAKQLRPLAVSEYIDRVTGRYARHFNKTTLRTGHLFESPFKREAICSGVSLLRFSYSVHTNAVRAKLVSNAEEWPYSSLHQYLGMATAGFIDTGPVLTLVGGVQGYRDFLRGYIPWQPESIEKFIVHTA